MDSIISQIITEWGTFGLLLFVLGYLIWDSRKTNIKKNEDKTIAHIDKLGGKIDNLSDKINLVDEKVDNFKNQLDKRVDELDDKIIDLDNGVRDIPQNNMKQININNKIQQDIHLKQLDDLMKLGPKLHRIIQDANIKIGSDHIFVGSFHNGNSSLSGIPYYKFDIIAERFSPSKVKRDCEFAHMYKNSDILRYDSLPILLVQNGMIYFKVPEEGELEIANYDDIIWRRMRGRGIKQIAIRLTKDSKSTPSGFVGVVKYDDLEMKLEYLDECGKDLEEIYKEAELKEEKNQD